MALELDQGAKTLIQQTFEQLSESALQQPRCFVHRDFHSRNLMFNKKHNPGIIDFQDAVSGPDHLRSGFTVKRLLRPLATRSGH
ncbi:MAG: phosphotransferase [Gammaproteobacteria bacterium]|nr:phosphotransferase [Gammaproteobacteria bacterium]